MILDLLDDGCRLPITLVYGQRSREELYYDDELPRWPASTPTSRYVPALSNEPEGSDWAGRRGSCTTRPRRPSVAASGAQGLPVRSAGDDGRLPHGADPGRLFERDIYTEKFLSAADAQAPRSARCSSGCEKGIKRHQLSFDSRPKVSVLVITNRRGSPCATSESLLQGMLKLGLRGIPVGFVDGS